MMETMAFRKAALVLAKLDRVAREEVLQRMPTEQATSVREELASLTTADFEQQDDAIQDFLAQRNASERTSETERFSHIDDPSVLGTPAVKSDSIEDLLRHSDQSIATVLLHERATTIAAVLSSLPGHRAAGMLKLLPSQDRAKVVGIWDAGITSNPKVLDAIAEWICDHLSASDIEPNASCDQHGAVRAILDEFDPAERIEMLQDLARENPMLARRLAKEYESRTRPTECYC